MTSSLRGVWWSMCALWSVAPPVHAQGHLVINASAVGREGDALRAQVARFTATHPGVTVDIQPAPDAADQRHQLYVQWLNARVPTPDVLQLDIIWTPEFAAAGWLTPVPFTDDERAGFFPVTLQANTLDHVLYAVPWFVDVGMLYWRTDRMDAPPSTWSALMETARDHGGFVFQGARYEGLVTTFVEALAAHGGSILDDTGNVTVDSDASVRALKVLHACVMDPRISSTRVLTYQEEQTRFAFENGGPAFMRNWPYAYPLMQEPRSTVAGKYRVAPMPAAEGGVPAAALGGAQLAVNASSRQPELALELVRFLTSEAEVLQRAHAVGEYPPRRSLYDSGALDGVLPIPPRDAAAIIGRAVPRPVTPLYTEMSNELQVALHAALTGQLSEENALHQAAEKMRAIQQRTLAAPAVTAVWPVLLLLAAGLVLLSMRSFRAVRSLDAPARREARAAAVFMVPALAVMALVTVFPLGATVFESLQHHDLRLPWLGSPWAGLGNFAELWSDHRFRSSAWHSAGFSLVTVSIELVLGTLLALLLNEAFRGRRVLRALMLLPWAIPTVVAALIWRFLFEAFVGPDIFTQPLAAWVPVVMGDVWKTVPFVALLLLASLQGVDPSLYEAARLDGASAWQRFRFITLPMLRPTMVVVVLFRGLDALRVFDFIYVMTNGGPGTATEPLALYAFNTLLQNLRFGYGSALSITIFAMTALVAALFVRFLGADISRGRA